MGDSSYIDLRDEKIRILMNRYNLKSIIKVAIANFRTNSRKLAHNCVTKSCANCASDPPLLF